MTTALLQGSRQRDHLVPVPGSTLASSATVTEERARIARELHDGLSQTLYALALAAARAHLLCEQNHSREMQGAINGVLQLAKGAQSELRAMVTTMRSDWACSQGLVPALAALAAGVRAHSHLDVRISLAPEPDLPSRTKQELLLISREALSNVVRHADASRVDIMFEADADEIVLLIRDDGRGCDPDAFHPGHFGFLSMRERAQVVGGRLQVRSENGRGTQVQINVRRQ